MWAVWARDQLRERLQKETCRQLSQLFPFFFKAEKPTFNSPDASPRPYI
jgi:hypothetical protein